MLIDYMGWFKQYKLQDVRLFSVCSLQLPPPPQPD